MEAAGNEAKSGARRSSARGGRIGGCMVEVEGGLCWECCATRGCHMQIAARFLCVECRMPGTAACGEQLKKGREEERLCVHGKNGRNGGQVGVRKSLG